MSYSSSIAGGCLDERFPDNTSGNRHGRSSDCSSRSPISCATNTGIAGRHFSSQNALKRGQRPEVVALSLLAPTDPLLDQIQIDPMDIGRRHGDWVTALHLSSARSRPEEFIEVVLAMIARPSRSNWDFQEVANRAVVERLARDADALALLKKRLMETSDVSEIASLPRYLSAASALDLEVIQRCTTLLEQEVHERIPRAGYDAVADSYLLCLGAYWRLLRHPCRPKARGAS